MLRENSPEWWEQEGEKKALATFHEAAKRVPAYKDFLKKHNVNPEKVVSIEDFKTHVPVMTKKDYLRQYPLKDLCWDGDLSRMNVISVSSGSTGEPFFWPRDIWQEREVDSWYELVFRYLFDAHKKNTLFIDCYSMGMYVAGPFTFSSVNRIAQKDYPLMVATPGIELEDTLNILEKVGNNFDQIIIAAYPPFTKDILETLEKRNIAFNKSLKFIFGAEAFSEVWRSYIHKKIKAADDMNSVNTYGSADSAILAMETPLSIQIRRNAAKSKKISTLLFGNERVPALFQYNPLFKFFEVTDTNSLIFTSSSGLPLIRYEIGDNGGLRSGNSLIHDLRLEGTKNLENSWLLPYIFLYERADFTVHLYGLNIYIDNVKAAIETEGPSEFLTGRFTMFTDIKRNMDQALTVYFELKQGVKSSRVVTNTVKKILTAVLKEKNSEYNRLSKAIGKKSQPVVRVIEYGDKRYFTQGTKQRWIR